jgi:type I restriction enzyme, R subunit
VTVLQPLQKEKLLGEFVPMDKINENEIELATIDILKDLGYKYIHGEEIAPDSENPERQRWDDVVLKGRLLESLERINPRIPKSALDEAVKKVLRISGQNIIQNNEKFHTMLTKGLDIEFRKNGKIEADKIWFIDFEDPNNNEFLVINQFAIIENNKHRRPDLVIFINGMPLSVVELKNLANEKTGVYSAFKQLETYKQEIPSIFNYNELLLISDGTNAQVGTLTSPKEWFLEWKADKKGNKDNSIVQLPVLLEGMFSKKIFLDLIRHFISFNKSKKQTNKILAGYHQYHAANKAIKKTKEAIKKDHRIGVIWHTQGSGKSLTMAFYASKLAIQEDLENPTVIILTDRNDLDDQLFNTFSSTSIMPEKPIQVKSKEELQEKLRTRASGGIIFATIQKFGDKDMGILSKRKNIIIAADEAHRSQYGFSAKVNQKTGEMNYGLAKYLRDALPNAAFIGFTGTPIDFKDKSTRTVFGEYIDTYDIQKAVEDKRTVSIYYEAKIINVGITKKELNEDIDGLLEEEYPGEDQEAILSKQRTKSRWARVEAIVGSKKRIGALAKEIVKHFEEKQKISVGKAMIVGMSRRICVELYNEIKKLKPQWADKNDEKGLMKVIMTGSAADGAEWQEHIRTKQRRKELGENFKQADSDFKLAIVRDMWLTGFDVPALNTLYVDKPMKGHGLMQAIARVNRVYPGKEGGTIIDYLGIGEALKFATKQYTESGGKGRTNYDQKEAIAQMLTKYDIMQSIFHGFNYKRFFEGNPKQRINLIGGAMDHVLKQKDGKKRFIREVSLLKGLFALANPCDEANDIRDDLAFFLAIKASLIKTTTCGTKKSFEELEESVKQIISSAISSKGIINIFDFLGIDSPDISVLSDEFLAEVQKIEYKNLAFEALKKLLEDEIRIKFKKNQVKSKKFSQMLEEAVNKYRNQGITSAQIIQEMVNIAKEVNDDKSKGKELGLNLEEEAFYDALADNQSAKDLLGEKVLAEMAHKIRERVKANASIDWRVRKSVQAKLKIMIKRLLREYGYPPDKQKMATDLVLRQAEGLAEDWAEKD